MSLSLFSTLLDSVSSVSSFSSSFIAQGRPQSNVLLRSITISLILFPSPEFEGACKLAGYFSANVAVQARLSFASEQWAAYKM